MKNAIVAYLPLLIASALAAMCLIDILDLVIVGYSVTLDKYLIIGLAIIGLTWLSMLFHSNAWVYIFFLLLILGIVSPISFDFVEIKVSIGAINFNVINLALLVSHFIVNRDKFIVGPISDEEKNVEIQERVAHFEAKFGSRSLEDLQAMDQNGMVHEAKEAIQRLIEKKQ